MAGDGPALSRSARDHEHDNSGIAVDVGCRPRAGFSVGALVGIVAGALGAVALYQASFPLLCISAVLLGVQAGFFWYFRLAAADGVEPALRARAISLVMAGGIVAGIIGPQAAKWTVDWLAPVTFAGVYVAVSLFSAVVLVLVQFLRIPKLSHVERSRGGAP